MSNRTFVYASYIASTPEKVWEALTSGEFTQKYFFGHKVASDWNEDSEVTYLRENDEVDIQGKVLISDPFSLLKFTWSSPEDPTERAEPTVVTFDVKQLDGTVKLTVIHENLVDSDFVEDMDTFQGVNNGWPAIMSNLKTLLESGRTLPAVKV